MRVWIDNKRGKLRGASIFMTQLEKGLTDLGCTITNRRPNIALCPVYGKNPHQCKTVYRIDGMYYDTERDKMNKGIKKNIQFGDGIVFQSNFSKEMCTRMLKCQARQSAVIANGMDQSVFAGMKKDYSGELVFVSAAHWRPNKRPGTIAHAFLESGLDNARLVFIGDVEPRKQVKHAKIQYAGTKNRKDIIELYKQAHYMIHICHIDSCPNSVVEGLSAGLPVVCNNIGGTPELVGSSGIIANIEPKFDFRFLRNMKQIPKVNRAELAKQIRELTNIKEPVRRPDLDISHTAKQYKAFFERVLA
tara:strand:- start:44763 stop:45674 length:912 start_codon:yes stop_codon:yes gene_type:complete